MANMVVSKVSTFSGHRDCVYTLEGYKTPSVFFSGAGDGMIVKWNLKDGDKGVLIAKMDTSVYALHYCLPYDCLVVGQNYEGIHVIDVESKVEKASLKLTDVAIFAIQSYKDLIFVGTKDGDVVVVKLQNLSVVTRLQFSSKSARSMAINVERKELAVGYSDKAIRIFDLESLALKHTISAHTNSVFTVCYSPDYRYLLSGGRDAHLRIWDVNNEYVEIQSIVAHMYAINSIVYSPDGQLFATCSMDKSVKVWDAEQFRLLKVIDKARHAGHGTSVNKLLWSAHENLLVSASDDRSISIWDINKAEHYH